MNCKFKICTIPYTILLLTSVLTAILFLFACSDGGEFNSDKINISASLFPQFDFARSIAGDKAYVHLILPPGTESHNFEPKAGDILKINKSDIFLYTGADMEPWAAKLADSSSNLTIVDCSQNISLIPSSIYNIEEHEDSDEDEHEHAADPHFWLDFTNAAAMAESICSALIEIDSQNADYYRRNADTLIAALTQLDADAKSIINAGLRNTVVFADKFAYIYFVERYGLNYVSAYDSCSSDTEPGIQRIIEIRRFIEDNSIPCVFFAELSQAKIASLIAEESNVEKYLFSTGHNLTKQQFDDGLTFIDIMYQNLENLKLGLN